MEISVEGTTSSSARILDHDQLNHPNRHPEPQAHYQAH
jgi:hypothetical protein